MDRLDGKGFHPTVRPFHPHRKRERNKIKVFRKAAPKAWQLAMMRLGMGFVTNEEDRIELGKLIESGVFDLEGTTLLAPMCGGEISCGSAGNYGITQADPSRPPPKQDVLVEENAFVSCEETTENITATSCNHRKIHRLQKYLFRVLFMTLSLAGLMMLANACQKEPYDVVIDWNWEDNLGYAPPKEMIQNEINKKNVNTVFINLTSPNSTGHTPGMFHRAREALQTRLDIAPGRVRGMGTIYVNSRNGAHLPNPTDDDNCGMSLTDSLWYTANGWKVQRLTPPYNK